MIDKCLSIKEPSPDRWHLQEGFIAIPGSSNPEHIAENYDIFDFSLNDKDLEQIRSLNRMTRYENW